MSLIAKAPQGELTTCNSDGRRSPLRDILRSQIAVFKASSATAYFISDTGIAHNLPSEREDGQ
jgi:hypothetical protein